MNNNQKQPIEDTQESVFRFIYWNPKGYDQSWIPKYKARDNHSKYSRPEVYPSCWCVAPGFVIGEEEKHRPRYDETADIFMQLKRYYNSLKGQVPDQILIEQYEGWKEVPKEKLLPNFRKFMTKIAIQKREKEINV